MYSSWTVWGRRVEMCTSIKPSRPYSCLDLLLLPLSIISQQGAHHYNERGHTQGGRR